MTSWSPEKRLQRHKIEARRGKETHLYRAMQKYDTEKFKVIPLDIATTQKEAYKLERKWIQRLGTYEDWGYNMTPGGDGAPCGKENHNYGQTVSAKVKEKMSISSRGGSGRQYTKSQTSKRSQVAGKKFESFTKRNCSEI